MTASRPNKPVDFGFRQVAEDEKAPLVRALFDRVAPRYDLMNDLMSLGAHRLWKAALINRLAPRPGMVVADVGGGTGDVALRCLDRGALVTVIDPNTEMLALGRDRAIDRGCLAGISWLCGTGEALPVAPGSVDAYVAAFSLRNVTRLDHALAEARRVLKPGGRFLCLEFGRVVVPALEGLYDAYSFRVLPALGGLVAGDRDAYRYLAESIRRFPDREVFAAMIREAGLERVAWRDFSAGIAVLHAAWRI